VDDFRKRGFLPADDPLTRFPSGSPGAVLDDLGAELPARLEDSGFRSWLRAQRVPEYATVTRGADEAVKHLFYVRVGFLASAYVNQIGAPPARRLPANLAVPLCAVCADLQRPPILSYAGYALYNWRRLDPSGPVALGNIDTIQNFVELFDEHWFILVHVDIEARAAAILDAVLGLEAGDRWRNRRAVDAAVGRIADTVRGQTEVLQRIPEHMSPERYFSGFRPYIRLFDRVVYDGVDRAPVSFRGETGAQSSVLPLLDALFKIPHEMNALTRHLSDLRRYMPPSHRALLARVAGHPDIRRVATPEVFDDALTAIADFRSVHFGWAMRYIAEQADEATGTGGTPYLEWLELLREETLAHRVGSE
jgi:indoleamine 2,3-dioxygenase